jgi:oligopeptide/dipeptide ABC transporter ATP-binding protein
LPTKPDTAAEPLSTDQVLIALRALEVHFALRGSSLARLFGLGSGVVKAVDGVDLDLHAGEVLGVVGESGSGKTTLGRALLGLVRATDGEIQYDGRNLVGLSDRSWRKLRRQFQMVFQDPNAALNPSMTLEAAIGHPLKIHRLAKDNADLRAQVVDALERVGLSPVEQFLTKYPSDLSGGQKQRAVIARAIVLNPSLLVADEPISMLDMSVRAKILQLMLDLKSDLGLTYLYITHDLASAKFFCDRIAIMYLGRVVEIGATQEIFADPKHPYTKALLDAIPEPDVNKTLPRNLLRGEIPDAADPPLGCSFHPRCPRAFEPCGWETRDLKTLLEARWTLMGEQEYERERSMIANLDDLDQAADAIVLKPTRSTSVEEVIELLTEIKSAGPDEPLWRGVRTIEREADAVAMRFHEGEDPRLRPAGGVEVACHLYT